MKWLTLVLMLAISATANAGFLDIPQTPKERCDPVEDPDLKAMPRITLGIAYCETANIAATRAKQADAAAGRAKAPNADSGAAGLADAFSKSAAKCRDQSSVSGTSISSASVVQQLANSSPLGSTKKQRPLGGGRLAATTSSWMRKDSIVPLQ